MQQTRRTTRRSLALEQGVENDLSNRVAATRTAGTSAAAGPANKPALKPTTLAVGTRRAAGGAAGKAVLGDKNASTSTAAVRRRAAFGDVTNGTKAKAAAAGAKSAATKPAAAAAPAASSTTTRRSYRTRSSTGGAGTSAVKEVNEEAPAEEADEPSDAMAIDDADDAKPKTKSLKRTAGGVTRTVTAARRPALAAKRANSATTTRAATRAGKAVAVPTVAKQTPPAVREARLRRAEAEERHRQAFEELEAARLQEEQLEAELAAQRELEIESGRVVKKARTSEAEYLGVRDEEDELEEDEEGAAVVSKWETEVEARPKDDGWEDLDKDDDEDPLMVSAYVVEVYEYLRELELTTMPDPDYMANQNEVTWKMRGILVDWLVEIHTKFRLLPETIFLAVNIIDRFLSVRSVSLVKFQLVGVTALFIAAKYEEVCCPSVQNFLYMTDGGYTDDEILKAERYVLGIIGFNLSYPNPINFLRRISKADGYDIQSRTMAKYLMEISIVDHRFIATRPSLIAAAANWLARKVLGKGHWDANLVHYSGYSEAELKPTAQLMLNYVVRTSPSLSALMPREDQNGEGSAGDAAGENPLEMSPAQHEVEHPNFVKKYGAKKFFKASTAMRKWAEEEFQPMEFYDRSGKVTREVVPALLS
ncbi:hypothetical protein JCM10207_006072 [Rhodosporidiobolus poonsookiae]